MMLSIFGKPHQVPSAATETTRSCRHSAFYARQAATMIKHLLK